VRSNDTMRDVRLRRARYGFPRLFGSSSLTLSIRKRRAKWVKQCIKRSRRLACVHTCSRLDFHECAARTRDAFVCTPIGNRTEPVAGAG
jgi:hypothetical protein